MHADLIRYLALFQDGWVYKDVDVGWTNMTSRLRSEIFVD